MNRRRLFRWGAGLALVILIGVAAQAAAAQAALNSDEPPTGAEMSSASYVLPWDVFANGGGQAASSSFRLHNTIGQSGFGSLASTNYQLHAGFWQWMAGGYLYLPLIER